MIETTGDFLSWWTAARVTALIAALGVPFLAWQARNAARDSRARSRPIVTATLVKTPYTKSFAIEIANSGQSSARRLTVAFTPELPSQTVTPDGQQSVIPFIAARYAEPIAVFPPGAVLSNVYYVGTAGSGNEIVNAEATSDQVTVDLRYEDDDGHGYHDTFPLDINILRKETESVGSGSPVRQREQALKHLGDLAGWANAVAQSVDELVSLGTRRRTNRADRRREVQEGKQRRAQEEMKARLLGHSLPSEGRSTRARRSVARLLRKAAVRINP